MENKKMKTPKADDVQNETPDPDTEPSNETLDYHARGGKSRSPAKIAAVMANLAKVDQAKRIAAIRDGCRKAREARDMVRATYGLPPIKRRKSRQSAGETGIVKCL